MDEQKIPLSWQPGTYLNPLHAHALIFLFDIFIIHFTQEMTRVV